LRVALNGLEDPIVEQVSDFLSSSISATYIYFSDVTSHSSLPDYQLYTHFLRNSILARLVANVVTLDDNTASSILSVASHTKDIRVNCREARLSDPASFITSISLDVSSSSISDLSSNNSSFFGLPHSFWNTFLNEKLANGSFEYTETRNMEGVIRKAPFILPDTPIRQLEWIKKV
ncbi:hypothetical protein PMAYCL1PPCAC_01592, partial [Pristionchus mayeri]